MGSNPSEYKDCDDCPVEKVSRDDVHAFLGKLNNMENTNNYRLPTEAEWEYACRAGGDPDLPFGNDENVISHYAWFDREPSKKYRTSSVAKLKPNDWKLYDMIGNVWEWVEDDWHDKYEEEKAPKDGSTWRDEPRSQFGVIRGASWYDVKQLANCTYRFMIDLNDPPSNNIGFRCVRALD